MRRPRVLVVDDSAFARKVVREVLEQSGLVDVVGFARDGLEALERIEALAPDVVTLDLMLPELDGCGVLEALKPDGPRVVVVTSLGSDAEAAVRALTLGALELVQKPSGVGVVRLYDVGAALLEAVLRAAAAAVRDTPPAPAVPVRPPLRVTRTSLLVVGTSTGGPQALSRLFADLPPLPVPTLVVVHIPPGYTEALAARLDKLSDARIIEATDGGVLEPGLVAVAKAGVHLRVERTGGRFVTRFSYQPANAPHRPSVDVLFSSAAETAAGGALGVVLTGMGNDGLAGSRDIVAAGGRIVTQTEHSCVVYGMPRVVDEAGLSERSASIEHMATTIVERL